MQRAQARALPRVGLLGNPSDGYGGRVLAFTLEDFRATVEAQERCQGIELAGPEGVWEGKDRSALERDLARGALGGGLALLGAALLQRPALEGGIALHFASDIPRQVGLAGSSAIVVACLRALGRLRGHASDPFELAEAALRAETEVLGVSAGPQDRVAQAYEGFLAMDFSPPRNAAAYRRLAPEILPPLWIAYDPTPGTSSGVSHGDIRRRYEAGEPAVRSAIARFVEFARAGEAALQNGESDVLAALFDASFDTRASIWPLTWVDRRLVALARSANCAAKLCGSGGAVVVLPRDEAATRCLPTLFEDAGFACFAPHITGTRTSPSV